MAWFKRNWAWIFGVAVVGALVYVWLLSPLGTSDRVGITTGIATVTLVVVTAVYAWHTRRMADEMREQRYDAHLPIMDIEMSKDADDLLKRGFATQEGLISNGVPCVLCNIGVGPAIDVRVFAHHSQTHERYPDDLGTRPKGDSTSKSRNLSLEKDDGELVVAARYRDVHGRAFKSKRKLQGEKGSWKLGPLQSVEITEDEYNDSRSH